VSDRRLSLSRVLRALRARYGEPRPPVSTDPFQLILWEQVAYLAPDERRQEAFEALRTRVGLAPAGIAAAPAATLAAVARIGGAIAAGSRAGRMRRSAQMVLARWHGAHGVRAARPTSCCGSTASAPVAAACRSALSVRSSVAVLREGRCGEARRRRSPERRIGVPG